jgi:hypothetical protein
MVRIIGDPHRPFENIEIGEYCYRFCELLIKISAGQAVGVLTKTPYTLYKNELVLPVSVNIHPTEIPTLYVNPLQ